MVRSVRAPWEWAKQVRPEYRANGLRSPRCALPEQRRIGISVSVLEAPSPSCCPHAAAAWPRAESAPARRPFPRGGNLEAARGNAEE